MAEASSDISFTRLFSPFTTSKAVHYLLLIGAIVYANTLTNSFVWDDLSNVLYNQQVQSFQLGGVFHESMINIGLQYRPIVTLYFSLMYHAFRDGPFFYHFFNVLFHLINAVLVFFLFKRFFSLLLSFFLAVVFLVHPMQVESATWISTSGNLYFLFGMAALLLSLKKTLITRDWILVGMLMLLSLLTKETAVLFFLLIGYWYILTKRSLRIVSLVSLCAISCYLILRFGIGQNALPTHSAIIPIAQLSLPERILSMPAIFFYYLKTFFFPRTLVIMQHWTVTQISWKMVYAPLLGTFLFLCLMGGFGFFLNKKHTKTRTHFLFFSAWLLMGMLFHLQLFPLDMTVADRWFYFPMVGLLGLIGLGLHVLLTPRTSQQKICLGILAVLVVSLLSIRTIIRNADWKNDITLYTHDRTILTNFVMENNLGWNYHQQKQFALARFYYQNSVDLFPFWSISLNNLAYISAREGKKTETRRYAYQVLRAGNYHVPEYHRDLAFTAWLLRSYDTPEQAEDFTKKALAIAPENGLLWAHLAIIKQKRGRNAEALQAAEKAEALSPSPVMTALVNLIRDGRTIPDTINIIN